MALGETKMGPSGDITAVFISVYSLGCGSNQCCFHDDTGTLRPTHALYHTTSSQETLNERQGMISQRERKLSGSFTADAE